MPQKVILSEERFKEIDAFVKALPSTMLKSEQSLLLSKRFGGDISLYLEQIKPEVINVLQSQEVKEGSSYLNDFPTPAIPPVKPFNEVDQSPEVEPDPNMPGHFKPVNR